MKLFHTSDWHLGRMLYGRSLLEDQRHFLREQFLPAVEEEKPACVILAGDLYDRQVPPAEAITLLDETLSRLVELGCPVCAIAGNHDGPSRIAILKGALRRSGVYLSTQLEDAFSPVTLREGGQAVQLFLLPYFDTSQAREFLGDETLKGEAACMEALIARMEPLFLPGAAHVLVAHCFAAGAQTSDSESSVLVGGSGQVPPALFSPFDYVALGHLHGPQGAGEKARYSGSPLKYSVDEAGQKKGFLSLAWDGAVMEARLVPTRPLRDVRRISGLFADLLAQGEASPCQDYVELVLEDPQPVLLAAERLRPCYPNLLAVSHRQAFATAAGRRAAQLQNQDQATVFASFLKEVCQLEPQEEDLALFREVVKEVTS